MSRKESRWRNTLLEALMVKLEWCFKIWRMIGVARAQSEGRRWTLTQYLWYFTPKLPKVLWKETINYYSKYNQHIYYCINFSSKESLGFSLISKIINLSHGEFRVYRKTPEREKHDSKPNSHYVLKSVLE